MNLHTGLRREVLKQINARLRNVSVTQDHLFASFENPAKADATGSSWDRPGMFVVLSRQNYQRLLQLPGRLPYDASHVVSGNRLLFVAVDDRTPMEYDLETCQGQAFRGRTDGGGPLAFTADGLLFTGNKLLDLKTGAAQQNFPGHAEDWSLSRQYVLSRKEADSSYQLFHLRTGNHIADLPRGTPQNDDDAGDFLVISQSDSVVVAQIATGKVSGYPGSYVFHNSQNLLVTQVGEKESRSTTGWQYGTQKKDESPYNPGLIRVFDLVTGRLLQALEGSVAETIRDSAGRLRFLAILRTDSAERNPSVTVFNGSDRTVRSFKGWFESLSDSGILSVSVEAEKRFYQLPAGMLLAAEPDEAGAAAPVKGGYPAWSEEGLQHVWHNRDNTYFAGRFANGTFVLRAADGSYRSRALLLDIGDVFGTPMLTVSQDRAYAVLALFDHTYLIGLGSDSSVRTLRLEKGEEIRAVRFAAAPGYFEIIVQQAGGYSFQQDLLLFHVAGAAPLYRASAPGGIPAASYSEDGRFIALRNEGMIAVFDLPRARFLYHYLDTDSVSGLVVDSAFHYDGPETARTTLHLTCGIEIVELAQVKDALWQPNLAARLSRGEAINGPTLSDLDICGLTPAVEDRSSSGVYRFRIHPRRGGLGETVLYVNDIEVRRVSPAGLRKVGDGYELSLTRTELQPFFAEGSDNRVQVKAFTKDNTLQSRGIIASTKGSGSAAAPRLFAVMVGVSDYKGDALDLKYAAKDAADLSEVLALSARKLLRDKSGDNVYFYNLNTGPGR
ncbi:MAG: hypothetical protein EOP50_05885, partial [Sphingobacteriales bacterium]